MADAIHTRQPSSLPARRSRPRPEHSPISRGRCARAWLGHSPAHVALTARSSDRAPRHFDRRCFAARVSGSSRSSDLVGSWPMCLIAVARPAGTRRFSHCLPNTPWPEPFAPRLILPRFATETPAAAGAEGHGEPPPIQHKLASAFISSSGVGAVGSGTCSRGLRSLPRPENAEELPAIDSAPVPRRYQSRIRLCRIQ